jgi:STE24 endopeptidase
MASAATLEHSVSLPPEEEKLCRRYGRVKLALGVAELLVLVLLLVWLTFSGISRSLVGFSHPPGLPGLLGDGSYLLLVGFMARIVVFPLDFAGEFWVERRFGLGRQGFGAWLWEWLCRSTVFGVATFVVLLAAVETLRWSPLLILPWCVAFPFCRAAFYDWVYYPLLARFYPVRFLRSETFNLPGLGKKTLPVYEVKVSHKTRRANAAIRLRDEKTAIYVTDTLLDEFTDGEERVVMAHEFGHLYDRLHLETRTRAGVAQAHRKLRIGSAQLAAGMVSLGMMVVLAPLLGLEGVRDLAGVPLLAAMTIVLAYAFSPLFCAEARKDEREADEYALAVTGDVENYVSVMRKLRRINLEESHTSPLSRVLFDTHPTYAERIRHALSYRRRHAPRRKAPHWRGWRNVQRHGRR